MRNRPLRSAHFTTVLAFAALLVTTHASAAVILSDNLTKITADTETATGNTWLAASFGTGSSALTLTSATLLLSATNVSTAAELSLYSDGGLEPGTLLGNLTSPASFSTNLSPAVFTASGLNLAAASTYWIVLRSATGSVNWGWTLDNTGTGEGFQHTWAVSGNAGAVWFSSDIYPLQFSLTADTGPAAVPEPGTLSMLVGAVAAALGIKRFRQRAGATEEVRYV